MLRKRDNTETFIYKFNVTKEQSDALNYVRKQMGVKTNIEAFGLMLNHTWRMLHLQEEWLEQSQGKEQEIINADNINQVLQSEDIKQNDDKLPESKIIGEDGNI